MIIFNKEKVADVFCDASEHGCVHKALADMKSDMQKVGGKNLCVKKYFPVEEGGFILVGSLQNPQFREYLKSHNLSVDISQQDWEFYHMKTFGDNGQNLLICGSDPRGTMWGIYDFCKNYLGVDPLYFWTDHEPESRDELLIKNINTSEGPKTYKFRGWFINDEDLFTEWKSGGGKRYADYPFYHQVIHQDVLERVIETALRLKQNLMIPASLLNIDNPAEENLVKLVTERGMYVTQHHIEPLGVSHFSWDEYWRKRNMTVEPSFITQKEKYEEIWTYYVKKWAKYENVIWQLGLRGRGDRPVWFHDPNVSPSMEERGKLISSAIANQAEIVEKVLGHKNFLSTTTLWMEGSELHNDGYLTFPDSTVIIFADNGPRQMWGEDFYKVERKAECKYGVYYHVAFWGDGPHLVQGTSVEKIYHNYQDAVEKGDTLYSILNVTNIREVVLGIKAVADITWDFTSFNTSNWLIEFSKEQFGEVHEEAVADVYKKFYDAYYKMENVRFPGSMRFIDGMVRIAGLNMIKLLTGNETSYELILNKHLYEVKSLKEFAERFKTITNESLEKFKRAYGEARKLLDLIPEDRKSFFMSNIIVQMEIIIGLYSWLYYLACAAEVKASNKGAEKDFEKASGKESDALKSYVREAVYSIEKLLVDRKKAEEGKWKDWYRGEKKMNLLGVLESTKELLKLE